MRILNFGFESSFRDETGKVVSLPASPERGIKEFWEYMNSTKALWFAELLLKLKFLPSFKTTDIVITEDETIKVGKPFFPITSLFTGEKYCSFWKSACERIEELGITLSHNIPLRPSKEDLEEVLKRLIGDAKRNDIYNLIKERRRGVDLSFSVYGLGSFRCNFSLSEKGLHLSVRWLDFVIPKLSDLLYPSFYLNFLEELLYEEKTPFPFMANRKVEVGSIKRGGLILHVGATGTGKSTCLASEINFYANRINGVILTYENPIEFKYLNTKSLIVQYDTFIHFEDSFQGILKHLLRNTPSIALIGEVRTLDEIEALVDVASRGHLIFATMHAGNVLEALEILSSLGKGRETQLASSLLAIVSHRLFTLSKEEEIQRIPLYEILLPQKNHLIKKLLKDKEVDKIVKMVGERPKKGEFFEERDNSNYYMSFKEHASVLKKRGRITQGEYERLLSLVGYEWSLQE